MSTKEETEDMEVEETGLTEQVNENGSDEPRVFIPGVSGSLEEGEELEFDPEAYKMFHSFKTNWPCLSFDVVEDGLGIRDTSPLECYVVTGTQAEKSKDNEILVMRLKNLMKIEDEEAEESDDDDDDDDGEKEKEKEKKNEPKLETVSIPQLGGTNRIRSEKLGNSSVCAVWNEHGRVQLWNITEALAHLSSEQKGVKKTLDNQKPLFSFNGSKKEGFALDWCPTKKGDIATGDIVKNIYVWHMHEGGTWLVDQKPLLGHKKSVEDLAWSPTEHGLIASCSADGSLKLWDTRSPAKDACVCTVDKAHNSDVNVISWNKHDALLVSGGDDAELKVWSLKNIQYGEPVARFKHHTKPITSVEWHPTDSTTFMASGEDDQTSIWDISTEIDGTDNIQEVKEVHWHPQIPGLALNTALSGFNVFQTINV
ncbi:unnamed protein product [Auanema sp. JU1783]|nr:unnamed protein product [Auanema sp. JU1783]